MGSSFCSKVPLFHHPRLRPSLVLVESLSILKKGTNWTKREIIHNLSNYRQAPTGRFNRKGAAPQEIQVMAMLSIADICGIVFLKKYTHGFKRQHGPQLTQVAPQSSPLAKAYPAEICGTVFFEKIRRPR
jgi:hypothetical protein